MKKLNWNKLLYKFREFRYTSQGYPVFSQNSIIHEKTTNSDSFQFSMAKSIKIKILKKKSLEISWNSNQNLPLNRKHPYMINSYVPVKVFFLAVNGKYTTKIKKIILAIWANKLGISGRLRILTVWLTTF